MKKAAILFLLFELSLATVSYADESSDIFTVVYRRVQDSDSRESRKEPKNPAPDSLSAFYISASSAPTEVGYLAKGMIRFYQLFISSQDKPSCVFSPSCSHFSAGCFHQYSPIKAVLLTSDRLQRCHAGAYGHYPFDPKTSRLLDRVRFYDHIE
ncbi:MAG: hypothetical protein B6244_07635 [Candidatus Cloacimonetes bacterium 4572_55]|nr:MAG: hypothetical protein B6244_07635 [Candidatus Cloacimonetes bacterium 4572_55]